VWDSEPDTVCFDSSAGFSQSQSLKDIDLSLYLWCF